MRSLANSSQRRERNLAWSQGFYYDMDTSIIAFLTGQSGMRSLEGLQPDTHQEHY